MGIEFDDGRDHDIIHAEICGIELRKEAMKTFWAIYSAVLLSFIFSVPISSADYWTNEPPIQIGEIELSPGAAVCVGTEVTLALTKVVDFDTFHYCLEDEKEKTKLEADTSLTTYWTVMKDGEVYDGIQDKAIAPSEPLKFAPKQPGEYAIEVYADDHPQEPKRNDEKSAKKTATITALKVEITPDSTNVCFCAGTADFDLTDDSYTPGGVIWTVSGNASIDANGTVTFPDVGTNYTVTATSKDNTDCFDEAELTALKVEISVDLEDKKINGVRSGLDESTLKFQLNGIVIPNSKLTLTPTNPADEEGILTRLEISYTPACNELVIPDSNTVKVDIDDMVANHMDQVSHTFNLP